MSDMVGSEVKSAACQKPKTGYENAHKFTEIYKAKNRVMAAQSNVITNKIKKTFTFSFSTHSVFSVKLNGVKRNVLTAMSELPVKINVTIADEIRDRIKAAISPTTASNPTL